MENIDTAAGAGRYDCFFQLITAEDVDENILKKNRKYCEGCFYRLPTHILRVESSKFI